MSGIDKLKDGFKNFQSGQFREQRDVYEELVDKGQKPDVALIACSDSRVDPAIVLQTGPGDIFMVRNVANLVPPCETDGAYHGISAALEYAVEHLKVGNIIVMGHAHCGGIQAVLNPPEEGAKGYTFIPSWVSIVESARQRVIAALPDASHEEKSQACEQEAILVSLDNLMTFPFIRESVDNDDLKLHGWYVNVREGELSTYNAASQQFELVK